MSGVEVRAFGMLGNRLPKGRTVAAGQSVYDAVESLAPGSLSGVVPMINGRVVAWDRILEEGDRLELVQTVSGGV